MSRNRFTQQFKEQLHALHIRPKHSFGQNFLIDELVYQSILDAAQVTSQSNIIEIGTGLGTLSRMLADHAKRVVTVENDKSLIRILPNEFKGYDNIKLVPGDFLQIPLKDLVSLFGQDNSTYAIVANLPYNITAKILQKILYESPAPKTAVFMMQREVAQRISALPGDMSMISLMVQWKAEVSYIREVAPESFYPSPEVHSAIVFLKIRATDPETLPPSNTIEDIFRFAHAAFHLRRKKLANSLSGMVRITPRQVEQVLVDVGLSKNARPQELSLKQWISLFQRVQHFSS